MKKVLIALMCSGVVVLYASQATDVASHPAAKQECRRGHGIQVPSDYHDFAPDGGRAVLFFEDFEAGAIPAGWKVIDNGDGCTWTVGTTGDLLGYDPPDYGKYYAYYSDDDAGPTAPLGTEYLIVPAKDCSGWLALQLSYSWGYIQYEALYGASWARFFKSGYWGAWILLATYSVDGNGCDFFSLNSFLPADSVQVMFTYEDTIGFCGCAFGIDNVYLGEILDATIDIQPNTLNLKSAAKLVKCFIELPTGYSVFTIDLNTVAITAIDGDCIDEPIYQGGIPAYGDYDGDIILDVMVRFSRQDLIDTLKGRGATGDVELTVCGKLIDGTKFAGVDTIRVISPPRLVRMIGTHTAEEIPCSFILYENYPNPFSSNTVIRYALPTNTQVKLNIYDVNGRVVKSLSNSYVQAGYYDIHWDGRDNSGRKVSSGVYLLKFDAEDYKETRKLLLIR